MFGSIKFGESPNSRNITTSMCSMYVDEGGKQPEAISLSLRFSVG
jgi:hypothetical protein